MSAAMSVVLLTCDQFYFDSIYARKVNQITWSHVNNETVDIQQRGVATLQLATW